MIKIKKINVWIVLTIIMAVLLSGCGKDVKADNEQAGVADVTSEYGIDITEDTVSFVDGTGQEVQIKKNPKRTIVLFASYIDLWMRNGGDLIGMVEDKSGIVPPGLEGVETVGKTGAISLEKIISLEPDLVILSANTSSQAELVESLRQNGIQVVAIDYTFKEDYYKTVRLFTAINDRQDLYEENAVSIKKGVEEIIDRVPKDQSPKVFIMFASSKSIKSRGSGTTLGQMLSDLNTVNIADLDNVSLEDKGFSMEAIIEQDPDFIFVQRMGSDNDAVLDRIKQDAQSNPAWASLSAVKNDRYILLPKDLYTYKANQRYPQAYEELAKILYPNTFE